MENLIIVGNGFDLAHGLRTQYQDFLQDLNKKIMESPNQYKDIIFTEIVKGKGKLKTKQIANNWYTYFKNRLLDIFIKQSKGELWSDLEYTYFSILQDYDNRDFFKNKFNREFIYKSAKELNTEFELIKKYLQEYLIKEQGNFSKINGIEYFFSKLNNPETVVLNFNYTNTVKQYLKTFNHIDLIHIHGELKSDDNPIIFGYAAYDEEIKQLLMKNENELLQNIKRYNYKWTDNEFRLKTAMDSSKWFEILIIGQSCGISDSLILNQIFGHSKVSSIIPIYYKGMKGYTSTVTNIERIANDLHNKNVDQRVNAKIITFRSCVPMIQHDSQAKEFEEFQQFVDFTIERQKFLRQKYS